MAAENNSPVDALLESVFSPQCWEAYTRRTEFLSSPDPRNWDAIDFPVEVALELTNCCNLRCVMCPVPNLKRKRGFMDKTIFRKVVTEISKESGFLFLPQGFGESLLHAEWFQLIDFARFMKIHPIVVLTNGMLLGEDNTRAIADRIDLVVVTLDGTTAKTYESVRVNGSFERVVENIETFLKIRGNSVRPPLLLRIIRMQETEKEIGTFREFWSGKIGKGDLIQVSDCIDWAGNVPHHGAHDNGVQRERRPCRMLWKNLTVYHNGQVSPCCYDAEGELIIGDVSRQTIREIWNGPALRNLRDLHLSGQSDRMAICSRCRNWH